MVEGRAGAAVSVMSQPASRSRRTRRDRLMVIAAGLGPYARPYRRQLVQALVASLLVVAAQLAFPWPLKGMVELTLVESERSQWLSGFLPDAGRPVTWLAAAFVVLGLGFGLAEHWQRLAVSRFVVPTINDARVGIFTDLVLSSSPNEPRRDAGDVLTRVVVDTSRLRVGLKGVLVHLLQHGLFLVGVCAVLMLLDVLLGLAYLVGLLMALAIAVVGADRTATMARRRRGRESRIAGQVLLATTETGPELAEKDPDRERSDAVVTEIKGVTAWAVQGVLAVTACLVLLLAVRFAGTGRLGTGDVTVVASYLLMLHYPMMRMGRQITRLGPQITSAERLARLAETSHHRVGQP